MRLNHPSPLALAAAFAMCLLPRTACARAWIGIDAWYLNGTHFESDGSVHDAFVVPDFHIGAGGSRLQIRGEGIPTFGITSSPNNPNLPAFSEVGFIDGALMYALDDRSRCWLGLGELVINQQTQLPGPPNPAAYQTESSRVAGVRYETQLRFPVNRDFFDLDFAAMPALHGTYQASNCTYCSPKVFSTPENGAMTDASLLFEVPHARSTWAFGLRYLNYSAVYTDYQVFADRNVGLGFVLRYSYAFVR
jgi:hypothetical protein